MLKKTTLREIRNSFGRYIAILAIVALGVGFFSGLKVTREAMVTTADDYLRTYNFFDYQVMSSLGFEKKDLSSFEKTDRVTAAEGSVSCDVLFTPDKKGADKVIKLHSVPQKINTLKLEDGKMPEKANECVVDYRLFEENPIGKTIKISGNNEKETLDMLKYKEYLIVGTVVSPIYLNFERGSTALADGSVSGFAYLDKNGFDTDYFTEVYLKLDHNFPIYSDDYKKLIADTENSVQTTSDKVADRRYQDILRDAKKELSEGQKEYDKNYNSYLLEKADTEAALSQSYHKLTTGRDELAQNEKMLKNRRTQLASAEKELQKGKEQLAQQKAQFEANKPHMSPEQIAAATAQIAAAEKKLLTNESSIKEGFAQITAGEKQLAKSKIEIEKGFKSYYSGKSEAETAFSEAEAEFANARKKLAEAEEEIRDIKAPDTYVLDRNTNIGYACFESDSGIIDGIAKVFPVFFFMVAALVCMTTMTRMVDEQRTQIGVLKALGYGNGAVISKYLFYAASASLIGCIIGFFSCCYIFPLVIWNAYGMMYDFSGELYYIIDGVLFAISLTVSLLCSMGATMLSCYAEFREVPAQLIRPKAPKEGKRILLERIPFIWNRLSFLYKVSFRNIFRYKKRFLMMVLGISGCTALLLTGLGVRDSVKNVVDYQFDEIQVFDYSIVFDKNMNENRQSRFTEQSNDYIRDLIFIHQSSSDLVTENEVKSISLIAADCERFHNFVRLSDEDGVKITYPKRGEAVICKKLADTYHLKKGSEITLRDENMKEMKVSVSAVCENYVENYIYITRQTFEDGFGYAPAVKSALVHAADNSRSGVQTSAAKTLNEKGVTTVSVNNDMRDRVDNMMKSLDYVIALVIISAGALAFIVLYNLTNINITERVREIATIKVLGFYPKETSAYVFRENFFLTGISALVGLILGKALHAFVMSQIQVDMLSFDVRISTVSYVLAVVLTFVFAAAVNLAMYYKLERISMTESLKSIE